MQFLVSRDKPSKSWDATTLAEGSTVCVDRDLLTRIQENEKVLCSKITLSSFNKDYETKLLVDSSIKWGVAYVLLQISPEGVITIIWCGSCSVPKAWHSLSAVECECARIGWAVNHARFYLRGCPRFVVVTDHLPLVKVMTGSLENLSPKLFRVITDLLEYNFKMEWTPGKNHLFVDSLGRVPQMESFRDYDPLTGGDKTEWGNGGRFGSHQNCNNVTHLDTRVRLQITASGDGGRQGGCNLPESFARSGGEE